MSNPWEQIKTPKIQFNVRRVDHLHHYDFFWAKDVAGDYLFLFQCNNRISFPRELPCLHGVEIIQPVPVDDSKTRLLLRLNSKDDWDLFYSLCIDLLEAARGMPNEESVVPVIIRRLERWHIFLKRHRQKLMSESEIKGLIGELLFLRDYLFEKYSVFDCLSFWQGPLGAPQDYNIGDAAVEVKCKLGTSKPRIKISSIDQLNCMLDKFFLFVVTLGKEESISNDAISLPILTEEIRLIIQEKQPACLDQFNDLLLLAGYLEMPEYRDFCYILSHSDTFEVKDDFPKLKPDSIPDGVTDIKYDVLLDRCLPFKIDSIVLREL